MRKVTTIEKTVIQKTEVTEIFCDICGEKGHKEIFDSVGWKDDPERLESAVYVNEGTCYHDAAWGTVTYFDICPNCFKSVLIPLLKTKGIDPQTREYDV